MQGTVHLLIGAAFASLIPHQPTMFAAAVFSHYILDLLPHIDAETFADTKKPYTWYQKLSLTLDVVLVAALLVTLFMLRSEPFPFLLGAIAAQLPDLLIPLEQYSIFSPLKRAHYMFHWDKRRAQTRGWYIAGLVVPALVAATALIILLPM